MGRVIERRVVALRCEVRSCGAERSFDPRPAAERWWDLAGVLSALVEEGWVFVCKGRLRAYCPAHAERIGACTCQSSKRHNCAAHDHATAEDVWTSTQLPKTLSVLEHSR